MKKTIFFGLILMFFSCKKKMTREELETKLKDTFTSSLYERVNYDSSKVKYRVLEIAYFEEPNAYSCEFKVKMILPDHDTTGSMKATIMKDFSKVDRIN